MSDDLAESLDRDRDERPGRHSRERNRAADVVCEECSIALRARPRRRKRLDPDERTRPEWWIAVIGVQDVGKGRVPKQKRVQAVFANGQDVQWVDAPALSPGQDAVFLLHRVRRRTRPGAPWSFSIQRTCSHRSISTTFAGWWAIE